ncbi:triose-phosphate isomerase [Sphingorhabdus sp.]|jgi:triosephosphate isomerase|uniref:triose-phosphate isomerase n=1 Tax=Sphingorhabdus sp. TaxID=1902408 RepID=UPI003BB114CA|nr:triose-phosphate isomerase [Sphingomonadales bacterium]MBK9431822.1 triose-phosphate isomerase [Sphingomonadales bacterium]MBL0022900.1 triose-phosphate isomerase [Sphingomonadales bacterium]
MRKLIAGNWKMNGLSADLGAIEAIASAVAGHSGVDTALCLPATLVGPAATRLPGYAIGGQDCHMAVSGAHTGCVSAAMLADAGAKLTIVGHSERRAAQGESDADVRGKASAARAAGLNAIVCVGETEAERDAGQAESVVLGQLQGSLPDDANGSWLSVAYEPVWAIGTGRIPSIDDVTAMHDAIRNALVARFGEGGAAIRILYGGSMNGDNAAVLLTVANVDGGLIGGASLSAEKFLPIVEAAAAA